MNGYFKNQPLANFIYYCGYMEECEMEEPNEDAVEYIPFDDNDFNIDSDDFNIDSDDYLFDF